MGRHDQDLSARTAHERRLAVHARAERVRVQPNDVQTDPAYVRAEEMSAQYFRDVWRQAEIIAGKRGPEIQRTAADINHADEALRSGFPRRRMLRRCSGQLVTVCGAIFAGVGGGGLWTEPEPRANFAYYFVFLVVGLVAAAIGILVGHSSD